MIDVIFEKGREGRKTLSGLSSAALLGPSPAQLPWGPHSHSHLPRGRAGRVPGSGMLPQVAERKRRAERGRAGMESAVRAGCALVLRILL